MCLSLNRKPMPPATSSNKFSSTRPTNGTVSHFCSHLGKKKLSRHLRHARRQRKPLDQNGLLEVPKKPGKTELAAGLVLFVLMIDPNPGCQVYGAAAATRQALNVFRAACKMVEQCPLLKKRLRVLRGTNRIVKRDDPDSFYAAVAADGDLSDGVNPVLRNRR